MENDIEFEDPIPPPPYEQVIEQGGTQDAESITDHESAERFLPIVYGLYNGSVFAGHGYFIGPHQKNHLYRVSLDNWRVTIHRGLHLHDEPLASSIDVSPREHTRSVYSISLPGSGDPEKLEVIHRDGLLSSPFFRFSLDTDLSGTRQREDFEWKPSWDTSVTTLHGHTRGRPPGWKLVRRADTSNVLAICADYESSLTKVFKFEFKEDGVAATTASRWELMAAISALTLWKRSCDMHNQSL